MIYNLQLLEQTAMVLMASSDGNWSTRKFQLKGRLPTNGLSLAVTFCKILFREVLVIELSVSWIFEMNVREPVDLQSDCSAFLNGTFSRNWSTRDVQKILMVALHPMMPCEIWSTGYESFYQL